MYSCPTILRADYFSRIRLSDINDKYRVLTDNIMLLSGLVVLVLLLCIASVYVWKEHKSTAKSIGKFLFICLCIYIIIGVGNWCYYKLKHQSNVKAKKINSIQVSSSAPVQIEEKIFSRETSTDAWASYPPAKSIVSNRSENDWLVAATNNPSYRIYDLIRYGGMTPNNTQFLSEKEYQQSHWVREHYTPQKLHQAYVRLSNAWRAFLRCGKANVSDAEIAKYMRKYDLFDTDRPKIKDAANPQLIKDLQCVPLQD